MIVGFPSQRASNAENISWHDIILVAVYNWAALDHNQNEEIQYLIALATDTTRWVDGTPTSEVTPVTIW